MSDAYGVIKRLFTVPVILFLVASLVSLKDILCNTS